MTRRTRRIRIRDLSLAFFLSLAPPAWPVTICQPGKQTLPMPMASNVGPNSHSAQGCDFGTAWFEATNGCWFLPYHVGTNPTNVGTATTGIGTVMVNPGIASFGNCDLRTTPQVNDVGTFVNSDFMVPYEAGGLNFEDAVEVCGGSVRPGIPPYGPPSEYVPSKGPVGYPVLFHGAASCQQSGHIWLRNQTVTITLNNGRGPTFKFIGGTLALVSAVAPGDSGSQVISTATSCHMPFGELIGSNTSVECDTTNGVRICGIRILVMPMNYTLLHFNIGLAGGNTCTDPALGPQLVNADKYPPKFLLAADPGDENTVHSPADAGLPPYKPIPAAMQADLDDCAKVTSAPNFGADMTARLQRLNLHESVVGPRLVNDKATIVIEVTDKVTPEMIQQFKAEMRGLGQGYPILLKQGQAMHFD